MKFSYIPHGLLVTFSPAFHQIVYLETDQSRYFVSTVKEKINGQIYSLFKNFKYHVLKYFDSIFDKSKLVVNK